ncbi:unnamed protein product [Diplocarpon coronariae]|nr:hypothetical protein JHW43_003825 [Diplocarpon mali]
MSSSNSSSWSGEALRRGSISEMSKEEIEEAVNALKEVYVYCTIAEIRNAIVVSNGDLDEAGVYLYGERDMQPPAGSSPQDSIEEDWAKKDEDEAGLANIPDPETADNIRQLLQIFPRYSVSFILDALEATCHDPEDAAMSLANALPPPSPGLRQDGPSNRKGKKAACSTSRLTSPKSPALFKNEPESDVSPVDTPRTTASLSPQIGTSYIPFRPAEFGSSLDNVLDGSYSPLKKCVGDEDVRMDCRASKFKRETGSGQMSPGHCQEKAVGNEWQRSNLDTLLGNSLAVIKRPATREPTSNHTSEEKIDILMALCPAAGKSRCRSELRLAQGNLEEAFEDLEHEFETGGEQAQESEAKEEEEEEGDRESLSPDKYIAPRRSQVLKRGADVSADGHRERKRARREDESADEQGENAGLESAFQWMKSTLQSNEGVTVILDSGPHPCRVPERFLRKIPLFATHLGSEVAGPNANLRVRKVSEATFDLAMQYAVCHNGRVEPAQAKSKSDEITALVDLAICASQVGLRLGTNTSPFMVNLKALLVDHSEPLLGLHISKAFEHLEDGHRVRSLFVKAAFKSYATFNISGQDIRRAGSDGEDSDESDAGLNPAQLAFYRTSKFRYHREFKRFNAFKLGLYEEFHAAWWNRTVHDIKYGRIRYDETEIVDPLTKKRLLV